MVRKPANSGKRWSPQEIFQLRMLAQENTPTRIIALKMKRTENAIRSKASSENISLAPWNQSPYNRRYM